MKIILPTNLTYIQYSTFPAGHRSKTKTVQLCKKPPPIEVSDLGKKIDQLIGEIDWLAVSFTYSTSFDFYPEPASFHWTGFSNPGALFQSQGLVPPHVSQLPRINPRATIVWSDKQHPGPMQVRSRYGQSQSECFVVKYVPLLCCFACCYLRAGP